MFTLLDPFDSFEMFSAALYVFITVLNLFDTFTFVMSTLAVGALYL